MVWHFKIVDMQLDKIFAKTFKCLTIQPMAKSNKLNSLLSHLLGNTKQRDYRDMTSDLKTRISAFELQSYSDLADSLTTASEKLQDYPDDFDINETDAYDILNFLLKPGHGPEYIRRLFCIQELITMVTYTTPKALPELGSLVDQIINNLRLPQPPNVIPACP